jgi:hypothetical protein
MEWIQLLEQNQPTATPSLLGRWICSPLYYILFRGLYNASSNLLDRLLDQLLPFDNYSDLRLSLVPSLEDGVWIEPVIRCPIAKPMIGAFSMPASPFHQNTKWFSAFTSHHLVPSLGRVSSLLCTASPSI